MSSNVPLASGIDRPEGSVMERAPQDPGVREAVKYAYVAVEGLIGAGKTTLVNRLCEQWGLPDGQAGARKVLEGFDDNPFLPKFYEDPERYAFPVELSFLAQRYHQLRSISEQSLFQPFTVADYSIGKSLVFASVTLAEDEYKLFRDLYDIMYAGLPKPDLLVYLHLPMERVKDRIRSRGRDYEQSITEDYLVKLQERYLDHLNKTTGQRTVVLDLGHTDLMRDNGAMERLIQLMNEDHPDGCTVLNL
jgi:deoxyguanosine kinase